MAVNVGINIVVEIKEIQAQTKYSSQVFQYKQQWWWWWRWW